MPPPLCTETGLVHRTPRGREAKAAQFLQRDATQSAVLLRQIVRLSVCLSVCPSMTLRYRDYIGWNSVKIISLSASLYVRSLQPQQKPIWWLSCYKPFLSDSDIEIFKNRPTFAKVTVKIKVAHFLTHSVKVLQRKLQN